MTTLTTLSGRTILLVEDDFFIAEDLAASCEAAGASVVGPAASASEARDLVSRVERLDGAMLDVNLRGETSFELADMLLERGVPVLFTSGYDRGVVPER
ncbi:MAG: hypothetical protein ACNS61_05875 [Candidatus Wenzhouxiangella sp. M2_3B_020]